jgi:hypothetical protein
MMPLRRRRTRGVSGRTGGLHGRRAGVAAILPFRGLGSVGSQKTVFERRAIKAADDSLHFIRSGRFDKSETFRFLCFVIANYFYGIGYKIFGGEPLLNIIGSDPGGEIAKKHGKAHSVGLFTPLVWIGGTSRRESVCQLDGTTKAERKRTAALPSIYWMRLVRERCSESSYRLSAISKFSRPPAGGFELIAGR